MSNNTFDPENIYFRTTYLLDAKAGFYHKTYFTLKNKEGYTNFNNYELLKAMINNSLDVEEALTEKLDDRESFFSREIERLNYFDPAHFIRSSDLDYLRKVYQEKLFSDGDEYTHIGYVLEIFEDE